MGSLRQLMYPKEFRIETKRTTAEISKLLKQFVPTEQSERLECQDPHAKASLPTRTDISDAALSDLGTSLWRIKDRMIDRETGMPAEGNRRTFRHLQSAWDVLAQVGVRILDHTNEIVPEGGIYSLKAVAYEPTSGLLRETVIETVKPTIYFQDRMIQMGEVIIGTPVTSGLLE
jgi:hypothetical protein